MQRDHVGWPDIYTSTKYPSPIRLFSKCLGRNVTKKYLVSFRVQGEYKEPDSLQELLTRFDETIQVTFQCSPEDLPSRIESKKIDLEFRIAEEANGWRVSVSATQILPLS